MGRIRGRQQQQSEEERQRAYLEARARIFGSEEQQTGASSSQGSAPSSIGNAGTDADAGSNSGTTPHRESAQTADQHSSRSNDKDGISLTPPPNADSDAAFHAGASCPAGPQASEAGTRSQSDSSGRKNRRGGKAKASSAPTHKSTQSTRQGSETPNSPSPPLPPSPPSKLPEGEGFAQQQQQQVANAGLWRGERRGELRNVRAEKLDPDFVRHGGRGGRERGISGKDGSAENLATVS